MGGGVSPSPHLLVGGRRWAVSVSEHEPLFFGEVKMPFALRKRKEDSPEDWMLIYGDMVTLLLCFFVVLISISQINSEIFQEVARSMKRAMKGGEIRPGYSITELVEEVGKIIQEEHLEGQVEVGTTSQGVSISLRGAVLFKVGKVELRPSSESILAKIATKLRRLPYAIAVEGHTDNIPISSTIFPSNWELSCGRAARVVQFLVKYGIPKDRLRAIGFADSAPLAPNMTPDGRSIPENQAGNRRVVIRLLTV